MKLIAIVKSIYEAIKDPKRNISDRLFLGLSLISEITVFIALMGDVFCNEDHREVWVLTATLIFVPILDVYGLKKDKLQLSAKITVIALVFVILPCLFFFGGGAEGGGVLWIIFSFTYAGLILSGRWRRVIFGFISVEAVAFFVFEYYYPDLVNGHSRKMFYVDTFLSIILVGIVCFVMTWLQTQFFKAENERAKKAADTAEELTRAQNRFFSSMSHEIRTPINSILGLNELILRDQNASAEILRDASGIQGSGKMLLALINDILDFSKMEAGSMDIVPVDYRIGDMLSEIVNMVWLRANEKGLKLGVSIDPNVPAILYGDEVRIKQIIINLLNNAVKYTQEGSVELHVEGNNSNTKTVELSISVSDTGMGIKKESLPYLFDAFKRVDEEKNRHIEGTGLGLNIVKQLVDLMGGTITVNSVYGEGSVFNVVLRQGVSSPDRIGELNIHNQDDSKKNAYECSFRAPDAQILIVDDNEMNLEVESKLLADTEITIDKALNGKDALILSLMNRYDVILMDHLMPEMDGIECLENIRNQDGGLNRTTPVVVLTANAGSENKDLYSRSGFDGYLVKPVSGETLESTLMSYIPADKLIINSNKMMTMREDINTAAGYSGKASVIITSTSTCDLPESLIRKLHIPILPFLVKTEEGVFKDGVQMGSDELVRYLSLGKEAVSVPPDESVYMDFFAKELKKAHHLIHIAITSSMSEDYKMACEAAKSFENVTVINSECISSATGIMVLIAYKLAQMNRSVEEIVAELEVVKRRLNCSFVIDTTEYMAKKGLISNEIDRIARGLNLHPSIKIKNNKSGIEGAWIGSRKRVYRRYIAKAFPVDVIPDPEVVFITFIDIPIDTLLWIKEEISKIAYFENVVFKQASAAISSNCGPGAFGILYFVKSNKSYNISSLLENINFEFEDNSVVKDDVQEDTIEYDEKSAAIDSGKKVGASADEPLPVEDANKEELTMSSEKSESAAESGNWYDSIEGIDGSVAITNSGSEDAFKTVLKIFYDSIDDKAKEIEGFYSSGDWKNYTIKVHALKSSSKLIGAMQTAEKAQLLENAGKEENIDYIKENHAAFMEEYKKYKDKLGAIYGESTDDEDKDDDRPVADEFLLESVYEGLLDAAKAMDCDAIEEVFAEVEGYAIPESDKEKFKELKSKADNFDYDGIVTLLGGQ